MDNMSELQRTFQKVKLARLPPEAPLIFDENEEDGANETSSTYLDEDSSSPSSASSTGTIVPSPRKNLFARPTGYVETSLQIHPRNGAKASMFLCTSRLTPVSRDK